MNWTELLRLELETVYRTTEGLIDLVDPATLEWSPASGLNWMTVGQLLRHIGSACGHEMKGFETGDWVPPVGTSNDASLSPAERMPTIVSIADARKILADRKLAFEMLATAGEMRLNREPAPAPWDATPMLLGRRLLEVIRHLDTHKCQLFYYLKLQGKPVHTGHLWGQ